jgi:hypothetical protein
MMESVYDVLNDHLYNGIRNFPSSILALKRLNVVTLKKLKQTLTTFHCYRFAHFVIKNMFPHNLRVDLLLINVYSQQSTDEKIHMFYLIVQLCVLYFKKPDYEMNKRIIQILRGIRKICQKKQPFHELYVTFSKQRSNIICVNNHTTIHLRDLLLQLEISKVHPSLRKMVTQVKGLEWIPNHKVFQVLKSMCNCTYIYNTSNLVLHDSVANFLTSELYYPKPVLDFAYHFKRELTTNPSSKRKCFSSIQILLTSPIVTRNLSFGHYLQNIIRQQVDFVNNKIISLHIPSCFCHTKCTRKEGNLDRLYQNGLFIFCKTCCQPINYHHKSYNKTSIVNDANSRANYFSCCDGCREFDFVDVYKCFIDSTNCIRYQYLALRKQISGKKTALYTTMCRNSRTCFGIVSSEVKFGEKPQLSCKCKPQNSVTCVDIISDYIADGNPITKEFVVRNICVGCLCFCFDYCTRSNVVKREIRALFV